jgi:hypothetical protein
MLEPRSARWRYGLTISVLLAELAHLSWEHLHGGVIAHHILNRADLPAISNFWGLIWLPVLAWYVSGRVQKRTANLAAPFSKNVLLGFSIALAYGALLAGCFRLGYDVATGHVFEGLFLLAVILPIYRAECLLGFVLGMTFIFGAILPTIIGSIFLAISALLHLLIYPFVWRLWLRRKSS